MNVCEKYKFISKYDHFHNLYTTDYFIDMTEIAIIENFEKYVNELILTTQKEKYSMIELGSKHAFYSCLFKAMVGNEKSINIMVEPENTIEMGRLQFKWNNFDGIFIQKCVGNKWVAKDGFRSKTFYDDLITLDEIFNENNLTEVDVLHCDVDLQEKPLIEQHEHLFKDKKFNYIFMSTHLQDNHDFCKTKLVNEFKYELLYEVPPNHPELIAGYDSLLVLRK